MEQPGGGSICVIPVEGIRCVHYIEQKDCTARFAICRGYMKDSRLKKKQVDSSLTGGTVCIAEGPIGILSLCYSLSIKESKFPRLT